MQICGMCGVDVVTGLLDELQLIKEGMQAQEVRSGVKLSKVWSFKTMVVW